MTKKIKKKKTEYKKGKYVIEIKAQEFKLENMDAAQAKVRQLVDAGIWFFNVYRESK